MPSAPAPRNILFVDDELRVLEGLQHTLRKQRTNWHMTFVSSGEAAKRALSETAYDVIVCDMRMPGMDGATLLRYIKERYPKIVRIVLSGYSEQEAMLRAVQVAHQFVSKPCPPEQLEQLVERTCALQRLITDENLRSIIGRVDRLPALPAMYAALTRALEDPNVNADEVARILARDVGMSAKLLQLVNSSFFASAMPITNVQFAVTRLGFPMIKNLTLSLEVFGASNIQLPSGLTMDDLQNHSMDVGHGARKLFTDKRKAEDAFMAGMLHDIGKLVMALVMPDRLAEAAEICLNTRDPMHLVEQRLFGTTHAEIGAYLLGIWGLPYPIIEAVAYHHYPDRLPHSEFDLVDAVYAANRLQDQPDQPHVRRRIRTESIDSDWLNAQHQDGSDLDYLRGRTGTNIAVDGIL